METYSYDKGLGVFSKHSDEKVVVARKVNEIIRKYNVDSVLDVGAGQGTFTSMIAPQVRSLKAIEKRHDHVQALKNQGIDVVEGEFPMDVGEKFDMVLASHSVPHNRDELQDFVHALIESAKGDGVVCIVTYKTDNDEWHKFMSQAMKRSDKDKTGENWLGKNYDTYYEMLNLLRAHGDVRDEQLENVVRGQTVGELFDALKFVYAGKYPKLAALFESRRDRLQAWLEQHCKTEKGYEFQMLQHVITLQKIPQLRSDLLHHEREEIEIGGAKILVEDGVFSPNPEKTQSTSIILDHFPDLKGKRVADVGTGSGALGIIAAMRGAHVVASDTSARAVESAQKNAEANGVADRISVVQGSLLDGLEGPFDYIFANLPIQANIWGSQETVATVRHFLRTAEAKLAQDGVIYLPWASFADSARGDVEKFLSNSSYGYERIDKVVGEHTWSLYKITKSAK